MFKPLLFVLSLGALALGSENLAITTPSKNLALTLYGSNMAMISEQRSASLSQTGKARLIYSGVPSLIDTSSVLATFSKPVALFSQNYSYDTISFDSLLRYHLGKKIIYIESKESREPKEGTLLSLHPTLVQAADKGLIFTPYKVLFSDIPKDMAIEPSLFWNIETNAKEFDINLRYLTRGLTWQSDYTLNLATPKSLELNSWITIVNNSGATYNDANITVLAGEVQMPEVDEPQLAAFVEQTVAAPAPMAERNIQSESFSGYHIYPIPFKETINDKEKKQISFIDKKDIEYKKYALYSDNIEFYNFGEKNLSFDQVIEFTNSKENNLGIPLPKGTVRVFSKDSRGTSHFVGAQTIDNIPKDEKVEIALGRFFDIVGQAKIIEFKTTTNHMRMTQEITLSNRGQTAEVLKLEKQLPNNAGKLTTKDNCSGICTKEDTTAFLTLYTITLQPNAEHKLTITYDLKKY